MSWRSTRPTPRWPCSPRDHHRAGPVAGAGRSARSCCGDVHQRHHRATQGCRDHPGQLRVRRHDDGCRCRASAADDRQLVVLPMFHANAQYYSFASAIAVGASRGADAHVLGERVPRPGGAPRRHPRQPVRRPDADDPRPRRPRRPARAAACVFGTAGSRRTSPPTSTRRSSDWFGCRPRQLYGMTETIPAVLTDRADDPRPDTMGDVTRGCAVDIVDAERRILPTRRGRRDRRRRSTAASNCSPGTSTIPPPPTAAFRDGWFLTGDRAWRDDDGRFRFDGRRSDVLEGRRARMCRSSRSRVALTEHPAVLDASVVGAPDPIRDEVPVAFVVPAASPGVRASTIPTNSPPTDELAAWAESGSARPSVRTATRSSPTCPAPASARSASSC